MPPVTLLRHARAPLERRRIHSHAERGNETRDISTQRGFNMKKTALIMTALLSLFSLNSYSEEIGDVSTTFKLIGANNKIVIEAFDDPDIAGITCYVSRAKTGGIKGSVGLAEDPTEASIACRQTGAIDESKLDKLKDGEQVFKANLSLVFKTLQVVRFYDKKRKVVVYLSYSDKIIDGSPKNSISAVSIAKFN
jgi:CreA protein